MVEGTLRADGVAALSATIDWSTLELRVMGAFVCTSNGETMGTTTRPIPWSQTTREALSTLRTAIENDLAAFHMTEGTHKATAPSQGGFLNEFLDEGDAPPA